MDHSAPRRSVVKIDFSNRFLEIRNVLHSCEQCLNGSQKNVKWSEMSFTVVKKCEMVGICEKPEMSITQKSEIYTARKKCEMVGKGSHFSLRAVLKGLRSPMTSKSDFKIGLDNATFAQQDPKINVGFGRASCSHNPLPVRISKLLPCQ